MVRQGIHFDITVWTELIEITEGQVVLLTELLDHYISSAQPRFERLQAAITAKDHRKIEFEAHSLKSSAGAIGLTRLNQICLEIEEAGRDGREVPSELPGELTREFNASLAEIQAGRASLSTAA